MPGGLSTPGQVSGEGPAADGCGRGRSEAKRNGVPPASHTPPYKKRRQLTFESPSFCEPIVFNLRGKTPPTPPPSIIGASAVLFCEPYAPYILSGSWMPRRAMALRRVRARASMSVRRYFRTASSGSFRMGVSW